MTRNTSSLTTADVFNVVAQALEIGVEDEELEVWPAGKDVWAWHYGNGGYGLATWDPSADPRMITDLEIVVSDSNQYTSR